MPDLHSAQERPTRVARALPAPLEARDCGVTILIRDLAVSTVIGVYDRERRAPQPLMMDLDIELSANDGAKTDALVDTLDYAQVIEDIRACLAGARYYLLERVAEFVAQRIIDSFGARRVMVQVAKVGVVRDVGMVGVRIVRSRRRAPATARKTA